MVTLGTRIAGYINTVKTKSKDPTPISLPNSAADQMKRYRELMKN